MEHELRVYADIKGVAVPVGRLWVKNRAGKESATFEYEAGWLKHPQQFALAPNLMLTTGKFHSADGLFNAFTDPAPDRWGRKLMRHFEIESAKAEKRVPRTLLGSDFLAGVDDEARLGALRFKRPGDDKFLAYTGRSVPPLIELAELLSATDRIEKGKPRKKDIRLVLAPGGSLGGARPKATVRDRGKLYIAKFPWVRDEWPVIQWEAALLELAAAAGVTVPPARLERVGTKSVLLMDRFDREENDVRIPFMSAMTALDAKDHDEDRSYLEILDVIRQFGAFPKEDARELWRRMVFNVLVSNTDDHLRNHGFLWAGEGWRLAPAYDMNPSPPHIMPRIHALALNEIDHTSSIDTVMSVSKDFGLALADARTVAGEVATAVRGWKTAAAKVRLSKDDIAFMAGAFEHDDLRTALASYVAIPIGVKRKPKAVDPGAKSVKRGIAKKSTSRKRAVARRK